MNTDLESIQWSASALAKWLLAFLVAQWLTIPGANRQALVGLIGMMAMDVFTGVWSAWQTQTVDSQVTFRGISKKVAILVFILFAHAIERAAGVELNIELAAAMGYGVNEAISIVENFARIGVPIPSQLVSALMQVKKLRTASPEDLNKLGESESTPKS